MRTSSFVGMSFFQDSVVSTQLLSMLCQSLSTRLIPSGMCPSISPWISYGCVNPRSGYEFSQSLPESWNRMPAMSRSRLSS